MKPITFQSNPEKLKRLLWDTESAWHTVSLSGGSMLTVAARTVQHYLKTRSDTFVVVDFLHVILLSMHCNVSISDGHINGVKTCKQNSKVFL